MSIINIHCRFTLSSNFSCGINMHFVKTLVCGRIGYACVNIMAYYKFMHVYVHIHHVVIYYPYCQ